MRSGAFDPLTPATSSRWALRSARGWTASSATPPSRRPIAARIARQRFGTMDHDEAAARREQREAGDDPGLQWRNGVVARRRHMGARAARVGRGANRSGLEERRIGDDEIGLAVRRGPLRAGRARRARRPRRRALALCEAVERGVFARQRREAGIDLDEVAARFAASAGAARGRPRRPRRRRRQCGAPARPPPPRAAPRRRRRDGRRGAGAAAVARRGSRRGWSAPRPGLSHRAIRRRGRLRAAAAARAPTCRRRS